MSIINTDTNTVTDLPIPGGIGTGGVAFSPNGRKAYVADFVSDSVTLIDTTATPPAVVGDPIPVGDGPSSIAFSLDGSKAYVSNGVAGTVSVIDTESNTVVPPPILVDDLPSTVAIGATPLGERAFVSNWLNNSVSVIDTATNTVTETITVDIGINPSGVAFSPVGAKAYVANNGSNSVSVIDTATNTVTQTISAGIGAQPTGIAFSPNGSRAYVANNGSNSVSVIDTATNTVTGLPIPVGFNPVAIAVSYDGSRAFVTNNGSGTVSVIDTATNTVINPPISVGVLPSRVAVGCVIEQSSRSIPKRTVNFDPAGGTCSDQAATWTVRFRGTYNLPTDCTRDGYVFLGWTRDPALTAPEHLLITVVARSGTLTAVWGQLPLAPSAVTVLANFLCRLNCGAALLVWPVSTTPTDTSIVAIDGVETTCSESGETADVRWCWVNGLIPRSSHIATVAWRSQYGTGPVATAPFTLA